MNRRWRSNWIPWAFKHSAMICLSRRQVHVAFCLRYCVFNSLLHFIRYSSRIWGNFATYLICLVEWRSRWRIFLVVIFVLFLIFNRHLWRFLQFFSNISSCYGLFFDVQTPLCLLSDSMWKFCFCRSIQSNDAFTLLTLLYSKLRCGTGWWSCLSVWAFLSSFVYVFCFLWCLRCLSFSSDLWWLIECLACSICESTFLGIKMFTIWHQAHSLREFWFALLPCWLFMLSNSFIWLQRIVPFTIILSRWHYRIRHRCFPLHYESSCLVSR